jgi:hypothetical protein
MKKFLVLLCAVFFAGSLYAQDAAAGKSLSVGVSFGVLSNLAGLGATIMKDGEFDTSKESLAGSTTTKKIFMSDKDNAIAKHNSESTNSEPLNFLKDYTEGGAMMGVNMELYAMYDMNESLALPLFARLGFSYMLQIGGGEQSRTLAAGVDQYAAAAGFAAAPGGKYEGATMDLTWTAGWMEIPVTLGISLPVGEKGKVYAGLGVSYFTGGWAAEYKTDAAYSAYLTTYGTTTYFDKAATEKVEFAYSGIGLNFLIGAEAYVADSVAITVDYWVSGGGKTIWSKEDLSSNSSKILTLASSNATATTDPEYLKRIAFPTVLGGSMFKVGAKFYIF